ncbi:uncharacterized protein H6S33_005149 [Morchella sextelata]|uniref:uncharacterized protein n=1 Tax=Morchella sextelata TaxID=1174677 RepID=UPI001D04F554|nr:uncharacterized protein H6S33_005149 [Morchella sextelata]KAH0605167.1 hypothetical protein H6S33_005149 [Morchella sextelata]
MSHPLTGPLGNFLDSRGIPTKELSKVSEDCCILIFKAHSQSSRKTSSSNPRNLTNAKHAGIANTDTIDEIRQSQHSETVGNWEFHASMWRPPLAAADIDPAREPISVRRIHSAISYQAFIARHIWCDRGDSVRKRASA